MVTAMLLFRCLPMTRTFTMKAHLVLLAVLLFLLLADVHADKPKKFKKVRHKHKTTTTTTTESSAEDRDVFSMMEEDEKASKVEEESSKENLDSREESMEDNAVLQGD
ncbi:hypothetical protein J437_LFUL002642 [Ladona fulva]|uniref:Uncharacterized protein n=1 Tax=Ladona fulva TaxID=123851 RepID=A0A8K0JVG2_LADFU|nr:hypothetical protein J437_LFUL002642 [Ladona fulva]